MKYCFPAIFEMDKENPNYINVTFPDLMGVVTFGEGPDHAMEMAKDVLLGMLDYDHVKNTKPSSLTKLRKTFPNNKIFLVEVDK